jgi:hypothetical protein
MKPRPALPTIARRPTSQLPNSLGLETEGDETLWSDT